MTSQRFVFVVRIWFEDGQASDDGRQVPMVRGSVERVDRERVYYFASLDEAVVHIEDAIRPSGAKRGTRASGVDTPSPDAPLPSEQEE